MYIISMDIGSTNTKILVMREKNDNLTVFIKDKNNKSFYENICDAINEIAKYEYSIINVFEEPNNLDKVITEIINKIEMIVITGVGASFINVDDENFTRNKNEIILNALKNKISKVNEFDAIGYGGAILAKTYEGIVVSVGTGTSFVYTDFNINERLGGTGLGGGAFVGLSNMLLPKKVDGKPYNFDELIEMARKGNRENVDLLIKDINSSDIEIDDNKSIEKDLTAANFAKLNTTASDNDKIVSVLNMIIENICLLAGNHKKMILNNKKVNEDISIIFIGTIVSSLFTKKLISIFSKCTGDKYVFVNDSAFAIVIGAYEYYMLRLRKVA